MQSNPTTFVLIPQEEWKQLKNYVAEILEKVNQSLSAQKQGNAIPVKYITAMEFMAAVRIKRTKFDQLVQGSKIKIIKKKRKIYVPVGEIERYFVDRNVA